MSPRLLPCPACARHVRIIESFCPFCGETLPLSLRNASPARLPTRRLGRAALAVFGAATLIGCGGDDSAPADGGSDTSVTVDSSVADATVDAMPDSTTVDTSIVAMYGAPPDTGTGADAAADGGDAATDGAVGNLYGAPPEA
jgi:hypothetical protein